MFDAYISAAFQAWAAKMTKEVWPGFWRLKKLGIDWQLKDVQKFGENIELDGPVIIENAGTIEIGNQFMFVSKWYKPIYISLKNPDARLIIEGGTSNGDIPGLSFINFGTEISLKKEVFIGANTIIGPDCLIYDTDWHTLDGLDHDVPVEPVWIGRGVWLSSRVIVLKGVTIGDNTVVAANSVVTKDLPSNVLAGGNPARVIRPIESYRYNPLSINTPT
jgi:acetyltransferase-like isoleucine patch superfamily enzyme